MTSPEGAGARGSARALTRADLGIVGVVWQVRGTFSVAGDRATVHIDMLDAEIRNPLGVMLNLRHLARAEGVATLRIEGVLANERLQAAMRRYGVRTEGTIDYVELPLR